jgi:hypothetical protein
MWNEAKPLYERCLKGLTSALGKDHSDTIKYVNNYSFYRHANEEQPESGTNTLIATNGEE